MRLAGRWTVVLAMALSIASAAGAQAVSPTPEPPAAYLAARAQAALALVKALADQDVGEVALESMLIEAPALRLALAYELTVAATETQRVDAANACTVSLSATAEQYVAALKTVAGRVEPLAGPAGAMIAAIEAHGFPQVTVSAQSGALTPLWTADFRKADSGNFDAETHLTPAAGEFWSRRLTDRERRLMVRSARQDALASMGRRIEGIDADGSRTIGDCLSGKADRAEAMGELLQPANVTGVRYHPQALIVEVAVEVELVDVLAALRSYLTTAAEPVDIPPDRLSQRIISVEATTYRVYGQAAPSEDRIALIPDREAALLRMVAGGATWLGDHRQATGTAEVQWDQEESLDDAQARAVAAAEHVAWLRLVADLPSLSLADGRTVTQLIDRNPTIAERIVVRAMMSMGRAEKTQVDPSAAEVTVGMDLRDVWLDILASTLHSPPEPVVETPTSAPAETAPAALPAPAAPAPEGASTQPSASDQEP